jgi:hypothetical protein
VNSVGFVSDPSACTTTRCAGSEAIGLGDRWTARHYLRLNALSSKAGNASLANATLLLLRFQEGRDTEIPVSMLRAFEASLRAREPGIEKAVALLAEKLFFECRQNIRNRIAHLVECCNNRLTLEGFNIAERYIEGRFKVGREFRVRQRRQQFHAFLRGELTIDTEHYSRGAAQRKSWLPVEDRLRQVVVLVPDKVPALPGPYCENPAGVNSKFAHICGGLEIDWH